MTNDLRSVSISHVHYIALMFIVSLAFGILFPLKISLATEYQIYSYHNVPPFIVGENKGLSHDLVNYLNKHGAKKFQFKLSILPRKRLDNLLKANSDIIIPWVSPDWFGPDAKSRFEWTTPLISDGNVYFSRKDRSIEVKSMGDLEDLLLGGVLGHRYARIDNEVAKGSFSRMNAPHERNLIKMLVGKRVDIGIMAESSARYLVWEENLSEEIHFSTYKHSIFLRRFLISGYLPQAREFLDSMILKMKDDPEWNAIKSRYQLPIEVN
ncbi:hypothetical protein WH96_00245 [Kiloniella spongiae]|uniref:Uncharacterized protein n=1 Tax=Kiloniella spongiae TaxID=1489064 RepID=A0A0H2MMP6_9PROT|nr:ABC transporter substrate-binding protein [Kiloniella spongiae]KLN62017.1 hypothetical protein WH96_00245 [Kiloniella spongiae]